MADGAFERDLDMARRIAALAREQGGRAFYVGGFVRDRLLGKENKDVDVEVHGLTPAQLASLLDTLGQRAAIGESFGIYALKGYSLDVAMPRRETPCGGGHRDFEVSVDPFIGPQRAAMRRDFTVNALMQDVLTGELIDPFGGQEDLRRGVLRHVNDKTFPEDPLRVLRGAQFAARFGFDIADETVALCRTMSLSRLSRERVEGELSKALLKSDRPSIFFESLRRMNRLSEWFGELEALIGVKQNPVHHAEGDVWTHTLLATDAAAALRERAADPLGLMLTAVTHDFGKAICTERIHGVIHAYGHETKGLPLIQAFLTRITRDKKRTAYVLNLAEHHMRPNAAAASGAPVKSTNRMFDQSVDPQGLIAMALADDRGRITQHPEPSHEAFLYERLALYREQMSRPAVAGRDLIQAGLQPDAHFSELLAYAHKLHLAAVPKDSALKQTLAYARTLQKKQKRAPDATDRNDAPGQSR